jgi:excisionase family DNA binding protein
MVKKEKEMLTTGEVCAMLGITYKTLFDWTSKGWLRFVYTPGGRKRYFRSDVEKLLSQGNPKIQKNEEQIGEKK